MILFRIFSNNNDGKFWSLAYVSRKDIILITHEDFPSPSIFYFKKSSSAGLPLMLMLLHLLGNESMNSFHDYLHYFIKVKEVGIIVGDFDTNACSKSRLPQILSEYVKRVEFLAHIT